MLKFKWETEFKETEIGKIPKDWEIKKLGIVAEVIRGVSFKQKEAKFEKFENSIPILRANNISEKGELIWEELMFISKDKIHPKQFLKEHDIIMVASSGSKRLVGKLFQLKKELQEKCSFGAFLYCIRPKDNSKYNKKLLGFVLDSPLTKRRLEEVVDGTNINNLRKSDLENMKLIYPSPTEQSRIATVLSWFDDLIENKKRQNEILEKTAMAIFKSWFVDFEPFKNEEFVYNEELGKEIPKEWEVDFATKFIDFNPPIRLIKGKVYPFVEMKQVSTNSAVCDFDYKEFTGSGVRYRGGDTLMARITPSLEHGKTAYVWFISEEEYGFGTTEFFVLHPKERYLKEFTYLLAKSDDFRDVAINSMTGTSGRQRADLNALKNFLIPIPPQSILEKFHSLVEPLFQKIILNQKQIMVLRKIRDALLPKLVFGKLRVEEI